MPDTPRTDALKRGEVPNAARSVFPGQDRFVADVDDVELRKVDEFVDDVDPASGSRPGRRSAPSRCSSSR